MVAKLAAMEASAAGLLLLAMACGGTGTSSSIETGGTGGGGTTAGGSLSLGAGAGAGAGGAGGYAGSAGLGGTATTTQGGKTTQGGETTQGGTGGSSASTDPCPDGQVDCNGACVGEGSTMPGCTVLATAGEGVDIALGMALDADYVYWSEEGNHIAIARAPKAGGQRQELVECDDIPYEVNVNSTLVAWTEGGFQRQRVRVMPKAGGTPTDLVDEMSTDALESSALSETRVYFMHGHFGMAGDIQSVGITGKDLLTHGTTASSFRTDIALTADTVYWASNDFFNKQLIKQDTLTGTTESALAEIPQINRMKVSGPNAYAIAGYSGQQKVQQVALTSGNVSDLYTGAEVDGSVFAAAGTSVYFGSASALYELAGGATKPTKLLETKSGIGFVVADASGVYVALNHANFGQGFVVKVK